METKPTDEDRTPARRRLPRSVIVGGLLFAVFGLIALVLLRRPQRQADVIEQIKAVGGFVTHDPPPSLQERITAYRQGGELEGNYTAVRLYTSDITGDWLRAHDNLTTLQITDLTLAETALTDAELAELFRAHALTVVDLRSEQVGDQAVAALADGRKLTLLQIRESPLNDAQFARLPLEQLEELRLDGTLVTPAGLQELRRAGKLVSATLDGRQFDATTAQVLGALPQLKFLEFIGPDVTDNHLAMLHGFTALELLNLRGTAVTSAGLESLQKALPNCQIGRR